ncbi:MAG: transposase family protein [Desulfobacula sp.]|nr:transposase family protein [Desulfobacula sp.]
MIFHRNNSSGLRESSFAMMIPTSTLNSWNKAFDDNMHLIITPDKRGKTGKVTLDMVRKIVKIANHYKTQGKRIRLKCFTRMLAEKKDICFSSKTVGDILTANDLRSPCTRKKQPVFYQQLRQKIPNGLISVDGSEIKIHINGKVIKLNLEMAVDTYSFTHTAFSISAHETSEEFIKVLKAHCRQWGTPIGLVCDSGSANLSYASLNFLDSYNIKPVPAGPANPKGNGSIEGAFSQFKNIVGSIHIDTSSPSALAKSVLQMLVSVYIKMRNKLSLQRQVKTPAECMTDPVPDKCRDQVKHKLQNQIHIKNAVNDDQAKLDLLHCLIKNMGIHADAAAITRAIRTITFYNMKVILESEKAFVKAVNRKKERLSLPYFFGILKRVQQNQDEQAYKRQCQERYNYDQMKKQIKGQELMKQKPSTVKNVLNILVNAVNAPAKYLKNVALRRAKEWTTELIKSTKYIGVLRKKFETSLIEMTQLSVEQKNQIWKYLTGFLNMKSTGKSVTHFS